MIGVKIYHKYFLLAFSLLAIFVVLGVLFTSFLARLMSPNRELFPGVMIARTVDKINPNDKVESLKEFLAWHTNLPRPQLTLIDQSGNILFTNMLHLKLDWRKIKKPEVEYGHLILENLEEENSHPPPLLPGLFEPAGPRGGPSGPTGGDGEYMLIRLANAPPQFLLAGPPSSAGSPPPLLPLLSILSLVCSLILGIGATIAITYSRVRKGIGIADEVITELQNGNLKARFPIHRKDEFGQAMIRFNFMASEIEKLVINVRDVEQARKKLLQELAHDLRTPMASLKSMVETLHLKNHKLEAQVQEELLSLSLKEIDYLGRLVEDLLFLAQVQEPNYQRDQQSFNLAEILLEEIEDCQLRSIHQGQKITIKSDREQVPIFFAGDPYLIRRLFRNALENSFSFAKKEIRITFKTHLENRVYLSIEDDGPGLSEEGLASFGYRRMTRKLDLLPNGRVSVGLGSVVMRAICEAYRGTIGIANRYDSDKRVVGAKVEIVLPLPMPKIS
ncbi:MAG: HAMP domain-containing histidine kinase [Bdellovibrionales bacterium]|nr:HAMP domain-containing histidine kinase [Bdellovibrionales bacterium]